MTEPFGCPDEAFPGHEFWLDGGCGGWKNLYPIFRKYRISLEPTSTSTATCVYTCKTEDEVDPIAIDWIAGDCPTSTPPHHTRLPTRFTFPPLSFSIPPDCRPAAPGTTCPK